MPMMKLIGVYSVPKKESLFLLELEITGDNEVFDLIDFRQPLRKDQNPSMQQVPYLEHQLNRDGSVKCELYPGPLRLSGHIRIAFFFHELDLNAPLHTPFGKLILRAPSELPERLSSIKYFEPD
jgi:hypothetical protein